MIYTVQHMSQYQSAMSPSQVEKAMRQNEFLHKYIMALDHALLWVAALSFAAFFHVSSDFTKVEALLFSTLVAYGAYLCESGLETLKTMASLSSCHLDLKKAGLWHWIALNIVINLVLSLLFLSNPSWIYLVMIILTAGWQKYMDGRIPPRIQATSRPVNPLNKHSDQQP